MKNSISLFLVIAMSFLCIPVLSQTESQTENDSTLLGLPGDNLDLYAVLDLFQKSKTIEDFEKSLNEEKTKINNLDLNLDGKVDFIKVETKKNGDDFTFILQVDVSKTEKQDVAVILVSKDKNKKVTIQIVGDKDLYGKDYIVEPKATTTPAVTANPGYTGADPVTVNVPASTTTVIVESAPIVQYVYSPAYVPYVPPYYYGFYPPYFAAFTVMAVGIYRHNNYYYHGGGYGYHGNTTVIHNTNNYNNYNNSRNSSNTVNHNKANGNYNRNNASTRPSGGASASQQPANRGGASASQQPANRGGASASTQPANRGGNSPSAQPSNRGGASASQQPSNRGGNSPSAQPSNRGGNSPSAQPSNRGGSGGGGYSGGGSRGGSGYSSSGSRGGGGFSGGGGSRGGGGGRGGGGRR